MTVIEDFMTFESALLEADAFGDFKKIEVLRCELEAAKVAKPIRLWQTYYVAFSSILLCEAEINPIENIEKAIDVLQGAYGSAEHVSELYTIAALAHSHFAAVLLNPLRKAEMGLRYENALSYAYAADSKNPRALYTEAISIFHKPRVVGGNKKKALALMRKAIECFDAHAKRYDDNSKLPNWGFCETWYAIGKACLHFNDFEQAAEAIKKVEAVRPGHRKAKELCAQLKMKINPD
ncbi:MAG: hypothetical protein F4Y22_03520 [Gammaproteobacteria bacterium]|nr:hypothetical protein [Gammaproteobacteria bacterium]MYH45681.1 hypothetical protein [Gammaproteobacteria bacterium]MYL12631.1 hypothetical protein [Gammaproteobacteria bacterium]